MGQCAQSSPVGGGGRGIADHKKCANGILRVGSRVKTQYTRAEGGDDRWYSGTIVKVFANDRAKIKYDDGDVWTGETKWIYLVNPRQVQYATNMGATPIVAGTVVTASPVQVVTASPVQAPSNSKKA